MSNKEGTKVNLLEVKLAQLHQELAEKNSYIKILESIIDLAPVNIFWKSKDGKYLGCNNSLGKIIRLKTNEEIIGKDNFDFYDKELAERLNEADQQVYAKGVEQIFEELGLAKDLTPAIYLTRKVPLKNEKGEISGLIGASLDITLLKKQEQALQQALEQANLAAKAKTDFLAIMSHELRNSIGNIVSALQLVQAEAISATHYLKVAEKTAKDMLPFLEQATNYFELESGLIYAKKSPANVIETIRAVVKNHVANQAVNLLLDISHDLPDYIQVDNYNLYKVLDTVVGNAIRFTKQGSVTVKAYTEDDYLTVLVSDTGCGMSEAQVNNLFNAFPVSREQNAKYRKFGLRLSIAKKILQLIGGDIAVQSQVANGTQVTLKLPFIAIDEATTSARKPSPQLNSPLTILVVEDDSISLEMEVSLLKRLGHKIDAVSTGLEAVKQAQQKAYDLIFMDITLPDISGIEASKQIHNQQPNIPIVAVTSHSSEEAVDDLLSQGILAVIPKPISQAAFKEFFAAYPQLLDDIE